MNEQQMVFWRDRYALRDANGEIVEQSIEQTWDRVSRTIANNEAERDAFYDILSGFHFVPGGRILAGAGAESEKTFYNCYVIPVEARGDNRVAPDFKGKDYPGNDSREAIFDTIKTMVDIMSRGGGVGINWSVLRPSGSYLTRISGTSSGPVGWMDVASVAVGEVIQGGSRRGAAMFMLDDWHPDVLNFINAKRDNTKITNANVSVAISNEFMRAVDANEEWQFVFPDTTHPAYNLEWEGDLRAWVAAGRPIKGYGSINAREMWRKIAESAWASGEPGLIFLDRYNDLSTAKGLERIISVNPCGEQGLGAYSVCNLGAMNLYAYVKRYEDGVWFDWETFYEDVQIAINFLDNVIDKNFYFQRQTEKQQMLLRRTGLGVMGLADALVALGIRYGTQEAIDFTKRVFRDMKDAAIAESNRLAKVKGPARGWSESMWDRPYFKEYLDRRGTVDVDTRYGMRNLFLLTQAPTGTTSLLAGVNSGIEPYFSLKTWRQDRTGGRWVYAKAVEESGWYSDAEGFELPIHVVTAKDVSVREHVLMQAAAQIYIDSSVSKTINAPNHHTVDGVEFAYRLAWDAGLKGIAYYRDGSRNKQVLYTEDPNTRIKDLEEKVKELESKLAFKDRVTSVEHIKVIDIGEPSDVNKCPACGVGEIVFEEGCKKCYACGWSAC